MFCFSNLILYLFIIIQYSFDVNLIYCIMYLSFFVSFLPSSFIFNGCYYFSVFVFIFHSLLFMFSVGSQLLYCIFNVDIALVIDMETTESLPSHSSIPVPVPARSSSPARYSSPSRTSSPLPFSNHTSPSSSVPVPVPTRSSFPAYTSVPAPPSFPLPAPASVSVSIHGLTAQTHAHAHTHTLNDTHLPKVHVPQAPYSTAPWGQKILSTVYQSYVG